MMQDIVHHMRPGLLQFAAPPPLSLYVHLPWCLRKCPYCDFNSHEQKNGSDPALHDSYVQALLQDLELSLPLVWGRTVHTVFIGGGTPSLFDPQAIDALLAGIRARLPLAPGCEITLEANPGTFEKQRFAAYRQAGVTRLSIGVQSFNDEALKRIGRVHNAQQARDAVQEAEAVFDTFNIDLMYALPGQDLAAFERDVQTALSFSPKHLSLYHLTLEPNTYFATHPPALPEDDASYEMLDAGIAALAAAGMERYEVSAYAKPGHRCQHNLNYWQFGDYLGIGAGAHSKLSFAHRVLRQVRYREPALYLRNTLQGQPVSQENEVGRKDLPFEFMLNALRLVDGFVLDDFTERTACPLSSIQAGLAQAEHKGWIERSGDAFRPTVKGLDFLSDVQALFLPD
jgi:putative oxygen-independent coproporphyrinogen III oxidase